MVILNIIGILYLILGFVYAVYILLWGADPWYFFPINVLGGPIMVVYIIYLTRKDKRLPL